MPVLFRIWAVSQRPKMQRLLWLNFLLAIGVVLLLMLYPFAPKPPAFPYQDKVQHFVIFFLLTLAGWPLFSKAMSRLVLGLIVYGGLIEVLQSLLTTTRMGDVVDWAADSIGVLAFFYLSRALMARVIKVSHGR